MKNQILKKGVVLVDKPRGMTSFDVVERVCETLGVSRAGHTGTLDPNVTGLMLVALEESRKAMPALMGMDKEYEGKMLLHGVVGRKMIEKTFKKFTGEIVQKPPVRSRVARMERKRKVHSLRILKMKDREIEFKVKCEAGTYIRKLVHDIGESLGTGAHMVELERTKIGPFLLKEAVPLSKLSEKNVITLERILERAMLKKITVKDHAIPKIRNGSPVFPEWVTKKERAKEDEIVGIFKKNGEIIALGKPSGEKIKTDRVFL
ncbi:MAG: RNA-guided pseudouridylation complex pseudouridine synthase subunit Cbf5 [Candidatus Aenigmatarchaeota archaeon]|nr:MAG: RNA-guided pseudouridylation complex pseudouridine synthase subunit Cbf5 [Candidatus Aenigmarchaeota archaeon]